MGRNLGYYTLLQAGIWIIFCIADYIDEKNILYYDDTVIIVMFFLLPLLAGVLFCVYEKYLRGLYRHIRKRWVHCFAAAGIWLVECGAFGALIYWLVDEFDLVPQRSGFLDGIEYPIFACFLFIGAVVVMILGTAGRWIWEKQREYRSAQPPGENR